MFALLIVLKNWICIKIQSDRQCRSFQRKSNFNSMETWKPLRMLLSPTSPELFFFARLWSFSSLVYGRFLRFLPLLPLLLFHFLLLLFPCLAATWLLPCERTLGHLLFHRFAFPEPWERKVSAPTRSFFHVRLLTYDFHPPILRCTVPQKYSDACLFLTSYILITILRFDRTATFVS